MALVNDEQQVIGLKLLTELCDIEQGLSEWEVGFVESLAKWTNNFTEKQYRRLRIIWAQKINDMDKEEAEEWADDDGAVDKDVNDMSGCDPNDLMIGGEMPF
jgi:hypothetical protein